MAIINSSCVYSKRNCMWIIFIYFLFNRKYLVIIWSGFNASRPRRLGAGAWLLPDSSLFSSSLWVCAISCFLNKEILDAIDAYDATNDSESDRVSVTLTSLMREFPSFCIDIYRLHGDARNLTVVSLGSAIFLYLNNRPFSLFIVLSTEFLIVHTRWLVISLQSSFPADPFFYPIVYSHVDIWMSETLPKSC